MWSESKRDRTLGTSTAHAGHTTVVLCSARRGLTCNRPRHRREHPLAVASRAHNALVIYTHMYRALDPDGRLDTGPVHCDVRCGR
jgi:hypothetical protein